MNQCCGTCKWAVDMHNDEHIDCNFPLPDWLGRFTHDPISGYGLLASQMNLTDGEHCQTYEPQP